MKHYVSQKREPLRRTFVYTFMTVTVIAVVTVMFLLVQGYTFDQTEGRLEQGGLLQFASVPTGATVTVDGRELGSKTNTKSTVLAGNHSVQFRLDEYRPWSKDILIRPGQVGWVNYARLVPVDPQVQTVRTFAEVVDMVTSPRRDFLLLQEQQNQPNFQLVDIRSDETRTVTVRLPETSYTRPQKGQVSRFVIDGWSENGESVLLKHTYGNLTEWIVFDRDNPQESVNINKIFSVEPNKVVFAGDSDRLLFVQVDSVVRRINLGDRKISREVASNVATFSSVSDNMIVFTTPPNEIGTRFVGYSSVDFSSQQNIRAYPNSDGALFAAMSTYFNKRHLAIIHDNQLVVDAGTFPTPSSRAQLDRLIWHKISPGALRLTISDNGRFVVIEYPDKFAVYDIELNKYDETVWTYKSKNQKALRWLDDYVVWSDNGGWLRIYDFDGDNQQDLMTVSEGFSAALTNDGKFIYGLLETNNGFELRRVRMIL